MSLNTLNSLLEKTEFLFSVAAVVPGVNIISAGLRASLGKIEIISGLASAAIHYGASIMTSDSHLRGTLEGRASTSLEYAKHGCLNILRAIVEVTVVFSAFLLVKDLLIGKHAPYENLNSHNVYIVETSNVPLNSYTS